MGMTMAMAMAMGMAMAMVMAMAMAMVMAMAMEIAMDIGMETVIASYIPTESPCKSVERDGLFPHHFRKSSHGHSSAEIHLKETVVGVHIALGKYAIAQAVSIDVWHPEFVDDNLGWGWGWGWGWRWRWEMEGKPESGP